MYVCYTENQIKSKRYIKNVKRMKGMPALSTCLSLSVPAHLYKLSLHLVHKDKV